jgi:Siphovirus ReqiPepy6 Gp37-like protein
MEWYTLDDALRRDTVIEGYESFIWAERYSAWGDFQILTKATFASRSLLRPGTRIGKKDSNRVGRIETSKDSIDEDGTKNILVSGRTIEHLLDDRVAMPALADLTTTSQWVITGTPGDIARYIFEQVCVNGVLSAGDAIPFYHAGTLLPSGSIPEPSEIVTITFDPDSVYNDIQKICEIWSLGFRLVKNGDEGEIYFEIYTGSDRTSGQTVNNAVIFSWDTESIGKTEVLRSIAQLKTVAYVFAKNGAMAVYANGYDASSSGADRRAVLVKADDIDLDPGPELNAAMAQKGMEELAKWGEIYAFDGELPPHNPYVYGRDYNLGDLVEERSPDGGSNYMLVTEQIFVSDSEGERTYPTFVLQAVITPGSWITQSSDLHWDDVPAGVHWNDFV